MDIKAFVGENNLVVFACQGVFRHPPESVVFQKDTSLLFVDFGEKHERDEFTCPLDETISEALLKQGFGAFGYFEDTELKATQIVPLLQE